MCTGTIFFTANHLTIKNVNCTKKEHDRRVLFPNILLPQNNLNKNKQTIFFLLYEILITKTLEHHWARERLYNWEEKPVIFFVEINLSFKIN